MPDVANLYAELTKAEDQEDGTLLVTGVVSDDTLDIDKQIADPVWLKRAIPEWFTSGGNVREMHQPIAAGVATEYAEADGRHRIVAHVVDEGSIRKVKSKVLKGFSIGIRSPRVVVDAKAAGGRIVDGQVIEVSLVDRPANPSCRLTLAKAAPSGETLDPADFEDFDEGRGLVKVEELTEDELPTPAAGEAEPAPAVEPAHAEGTTEKTAGVGSPPGPGDSGDGGNGGNAPADEVLKRDFTADQRRRMAGRGQAMAGGGFPIANVEDLENAIRAIGRAKDPDAARAHIRARAKALGRSDLIPDTWKAALGDLEKSVASSDETAHDPEVLRSIRDGLLQCLIAEAREAMGGESEVWDLSDLVATLAQFLAWWSHETAEGEAPASTELKHAETKEIPTMDTEPVKLTKDASADLVKSAVAQAVASAEEKINDLLAPLLERLQTVEKMAAPGGPARMRTRAASLGAARGDELRQQIASLKITAASIDDAAVKAAYGQKILGLEDQLSKVLEASAIN